MAGVGGTQVGSDDILQARGATSVKDSLLNLQPNPKVGTHIRS